MCCYKFVQLVEYPLPGVKNAWARGVHVEYSRNRSNYNHLALLFLFYSITLALITRACTCITLLCSSVLTIKNMKKKKKQAVLFCSIFYFSLSQRYSLLLF